MMGEGGVFYTFVGIISVHCVFLTNLKTLELKISQFFQFPNKKQIF